MKVLDLFSGIGGFSLGLERAGFETIAFCEIEPYCRKVLKKHWPEVVIHEDITKLDARPYRGTVDVVCGGFPCQDLSQAGNQAGIDGERSGLYREMLRIIGQCMPRYAIFENVSGLLTGESGRWFAQFLYDLAEIGFDAEWHCIPASELGAYHHRDRVWVIAYASGNNGYAGKNAKSGERWNEQALVNASASSENVANPTGGNDRCSNQESAERQEQKPRKSVGGIKIPADADAKRCERFAKVADSLKQQIQLMRSGEDFRRRFDLSEPALCGANDVIPNRLDRLRALGNAVVPQIPEAIGRAIMNVERA